MEVTVRKKKNKRAPVKIAPIILVATNSMARSITESNTVPRIPVSSAVIILHKLSQHPLRNSVDEASVIAR